MASRLVLRRGLDELCEQSLHRRHFLKQFLRVPLYPEEELTVRAFQAFDHAVRSPGVGAQLIRDTFHTLMMHAIHEAFFDAKNVTQACSLVDADFMSEHIPAIKIGGGEIIVLDGRHQLFPDILVEAAAQGDVEDLNATTY